MFRCIIHRVEKPVYWLVCDNPQCAMSVTGEADLTSQVHAGQSQQQYLTKAQKDGWLVSIGSQLCPDHAAQIKQLMQERSKIVTLAGGNGNLTGHAAEEGVKKLFTPPGGKTA
jgi:hypothetical protein